ncbi:hypothetical protein SAFG77S_03590 [Streptomyces afghaniensis]
MPGATLGTPNLRKGCIAMITTEFAPGSPCWLDLGTPDVRAAAAFYGAVLGWDYESMGGSEDFEGGMFRKDGKIVAGLGKLTEEGARSAWMLYFSVPDADATTEAVQQAGGTVRVAPMDLDDWGRMAQYSDPLGGQFAVWQPGTTKGVDLVRPAGLAVVDRADDERRGGREGVLRRPVRLAVQRHGAAGRRGYVHAHHPRRDCPRSACTAASWRWARRTCR